MLKIVRHVILLYIKWSKISAGGEKLKYKSFLKRDVKMHTQTFFITFSSKLFSQVFCKWWCINSFIPFKGSATAWLMPQCLNWHYYYYYHSKNATVNGWFKTHVIFLKEFWEKSWKQAKMKQLYMDLLWLHLFGYKLCIYCRHLWTEQRIRCANEVPILDNAMTSCAQDHCQRTMM